MKQTAHQWSKKEMQEIIEAYDKCAEVSERLGGKKKNKQTDSKQEKKE